MPIDQQKIISEPFGGGRRKIRGGAMGEAGLSDDGQVLELSERAYRIIYGEIIRCNIFPGATVSEAQLCDAYGLSRSPVRRALTLLTHDGLLKPIPRSGYRIANLTLEGIRQIFDMRAALEGVAVRAAMGRFPFDDLRVLNKAQVEASHAENFRLAIELHEKLHGLIYKASQNPVLERMAWHLLGQTTRVYFLVGKVGRHVVTLKDASEDAHEQLFRIFEAGNEAEAANAADRHIRQSQQALIDALLNSSHFNKMDIIIDR
ncbi:GntR family transcriptional regulator [Telmatospirillum siberiense]|uniref:GntR family transcriptional regulator n=1 Tax=Telmatospirillum siberiense TaxID=382514 RepID=UPI00130422E2|nr:GntR family transcriptional regulator [Telmatospirillum siberiense]